MIGTNAASHPSHWSDRLPANGKMCERWDGVYLYSICTYVCTLILHQQHHGTNMYNAYSASHVPRALKAGFFELPYMLTHLNSRKEPVQSLPCGVQSLVVVFIAPWEGGACYGVVVLHESRRVSALRGK